MYQLTPGMSRRQAQNRAYMGLVIGKVHDRYGSDPRLVWLIPDPGVWQGTKVSVLAELGRLQTSTSEADFWEAIEWLLDNRPSVKRAVAVLRAMRTGEALEASADELERVILDAIDRYQETRRPASSGEILEAIGRVQYLYRFEEAGSQSQPYSTYRE